MDLRVDVPALNKELLPANQKGLLNNKTKEVSDYKEKCKKL
jgi:hypothetical protein